MRVSLAAARIRSVEQFGPNVDAELHEQVQKID
jgi:hypothetical protein